MDAITEFLLEFMKLLAFLEFGGHNSVGGRVGFECSDITILPCVGMLY